MEGITEDHPNQEWAALAKEGVPREWIYYRIMKTMHWSWHDLTATPMSVIQWLLVCIKLDNQFKATVMNAETPLKVGRK